MTDQTEVVDSSHIIVNNQMTSDSQKSPQYTDTEVTQEDRTVKFWNSAAFSDDDIQSGSRRVRAGIIIDDGPPVWTSWHNYNSPATAQTVLQPEDEIVVPYTGEDHDYDVKTRVQVEEMSGVIWSGLFDHTTQSYTATVKEV